MKHIFTLLLILFTSFLWAQFDKDPSKMPANPTDTIPAKLERGVLQTFKVVFSGKPGKAALYSLVIPGGGQLYNRKYWKAPIVWTADAGALTWYFYNRNQYRNFQSTYERKLQGEDVSYRGVSTTESLRQFRNEFLLDTERAGITIIVLHLVSVIEAFTDRHLMDFDISEDLSLHVKQLEIPFENPTTGIGLAYRF